MGDFRLWQPFRGQPVVPLITLSHAVHRAIVAFMDLGITILINPD